MVEVNGSAEAAVLVSGGVDSAILCVDLLREYPIIHPIYVRFGLRWEDVELERLRNYLSHVGKRFPGIRPLTVLEEPIAEIYGGHWSNSGKRGVPDFDTAHDAVYLPGRNLLLATKAAVWCRLREVEILAFGTLKGNPFPDSAKEFFQDLAELLNRAMSGQLKIIRPYERLSKTQVIARGDGLPLDLTFSCLNPSNRRHCGVCNKCEERRRAFRNVGCPDLTDYATNPAASLQDEPHACTE